MTASTRTPTRTQRKPADKARVTTPAKKDAPAKEISAAAQRQGSRRTPPAERAYTRRAQRGDGAKRAQRGEGPKRSQRAEGSNRAQRAEGAKRAERVDAAKARPAQPARNRRLRLRLPRSRASFVLLVMVLLAAGVATTLLLSTQAIADSYRLEQIRQENANLAERSQQLQQDVAKEGSASSLAERARALGMVPAGEPAHLVQHPDGSITVVGVPKKATAPPPPPPPSTSAPPTQSDSAAPPAGGDAPQAGQQPQSGTQPGTER